ncbi:DUF2142 domain-containing protein [Acetobacter pasteurianus]|uniref:DUF2142 domain-containing protein n=1 Tax=Acetobacter pasteurianus TaxID=438 RepID=UPI003D151407
MIKNSLSAICADILERFINRRTLLAFYACFAIVTGLFCIVLAPPFQVADEPNHFMRAVQIANGGLVGIRRSPLESGAMLPESVPIVAGSFDKLKFAPQEKVTPDMITQAMMVRWPSARIFVGLPNTVLYPPTSYIGAASGIIWGRFLHSSILGTFYLARVGNLLANVTVSVIALSLMPGAGIFMLAILMLPMSISLMASCSQDGMVLALTALGIACALRGMQVASGRQQYVLACLGGVAFGCVAAAKAPYLMMVFVPVLFANRQTIRYALASCASGVSVFFIWAVFGLRPVMTKLAPPGVSAAQQVAFGLHHPVRFVNALSTTLTVSWKDLSHQAIGVLGWLDVPLSSAVYRISYIFLVFSFLASFVCVRRLNMREGAVWRLAGLLLIGLAAFIGIFAALYVTWTPVGKDVVEGVQGRYFLPIFMLGALCPFLWKKHEVLENSQYMNIRNSMAGFVVNSVMVAFMVFCYIAICAALSNRYW